VRIFKRVPLEHIIIKKEKRKMWYKSKWFWLNVIAVVLAVIQYFISNEMFVNLLPWFGLVVVILNMIVGMLQSVQLQKLKKQLKE